MLRQPVDVLQTDSGHIKKADRNLIDGTLSPSHVSFDSLATVCKYVVPSGYGTSPEADQVVDVDEKKILDAGARLYYASVNEKEGKIFTTTSRALAVVGVGERIGEAEEIAEKGLAHISGNITMRHDIGKADMLQKKVERMERLLAGKG